MRQSDNQAGFVLIEVVLASSLLAIFVTAFVGALLYGQQAADLVGRRMQAVLLAEEGMEAVRNLRDGSFDNLTAGVYGLQIVGNEWTLSGANDTTGIFTRQVTVTDSGANRKAVTVVVTWQQSQTRSGSLSATTLLTEWPFAPPPPPPPDP